jgi:hypothetical protein
MVSIGLLSRIYKCETPYINEFLEYYIKYIKVDNIYLIVTDNTDFTKIIDTKFKVTLITNNEILSTHVDKVFKYALKYIKDDWILNVDVDEFLYLNGVNLKNILINCNIVRFRWVLCPACNLFNKSIKEIIKNNKLINFNNYKSIALKKDILKMKCHNMKMKNRREKFTNAFIIHISSRGIYDMLLRSLNQKFKSNNINIIKNFIDSKINKFLDLPIRIRNLILQKNSTNYNSSKIIYPKLKYGIDNNLEKNIKQRLYHHWINLYYRKTYAGS